MQVYQTTKSCNACGTGRDINVIVDIPLEEIKLSPVAVACSCGYFKERVHYPVSFSIYKSKKDTILGCIRNTEKDLEIEDLMEEQFGCVTERIQARRAYLQQQLEIYSKELKDLGSTPIPDHLMGEVQ